MNRLDVERARAFLRNAEQRAGVLERSPLLEVYDEQLALHSG